MDWWTNKEAVIEGLCTKIEDAIAGRYVEVEEEPIRLYDSGHTSGGYMPTNVSFESSDYNTLQEAFENRGGAVVSEEPLQLVEIVPYEPAELEQRSLPVERVINEEYDDLIMDYIEAVIEKEAPIREELLCKRVLRAVNIARMGVRVAEYMEYAIDCVSPRYTTDDHRTFWSEDQDPDEYKTIRQSNERDASHIPYEEAKNAAIHILDQQGSQPKDSLIREMAKLFGYSRVGDNVYYTMQKGIELAISKSLAEESDAE